MASQAIMPAASTAGVPIRNGSSTALKQQYKPSPAGNKAGLENSRRQSGSPVDGPRRRNSTQKAWSHGTNPITQKITNPIHTNGVSHTSKGNSKLAAASARESNTPDKHAEDRLIFLLTAMVGRSASVTTSNGDKFEGIFSGCTVGSIDAVYTLSMTKKLASVSSPQANGMSEDGPNYVGAGLEHTQSFEMKDVIDLACDGVSFSDVTSKSANGVSSGFRTDADISGNLAIRERNLQRWEPSTDMDVDLSLEGVSNGISGSATGGWDQFEANARMYGVQTSYDEGLYTTSIDRSNPQYRQRLARAEKLAREIESGSASNAHVAEERGQVIGDDSGMDEEDKYSGVHRGAARASGLYSGATNRYTPPARRAPTGQPTVAGAPVDPAIISSQLARPLGASTAKTPVYDHVPAETAKASSAAAATAAAALKDKLAIEAPAPAAALAPVVTAIHAVAPAVTPAQAKATPNIKGIPDAASQRQSLSLAATELPGSTPPNPKVLGGSATANVENEVRDAFKQFANNEKMRVEDRRRNVRKNDKDFKLNDLMKWSKGFKLHTPVPKDLVGILAKDKAKQAEIMEKAQREADAAKEAARPAPPIEVKPVTYAAEVRPQRAAAVQRADAAPIPSQGLADRQTLPRGRSGQPGPGAFNPATMRPMPPSNYSMLSARQGPGPGLGTRLAGSQQQHGRGGPPVGVPSPAPIYEARAPPTGLAATHTEVGDPHKYGTFPTPSSATSSKFNVRAMEFRPNPAVSSFKPTGMPSAASSPRSTINARPVLSGAREDEKSGEFFEGKTSMPHSQRKSICQFFNPIRRLKATATATEANETYISNGGIRPAHKTGPRWDVAEENKERTYTEMFDKAPLSNRSFSPSHLPHANPPLPHQHQLPFHLQIGGAGLPPQVPSHPAHHPMHQSHHPLQMGPPHQFDEHHRLHVASTASSVLPSPRLGMAYPSPMNQHAQMVYSQAMPPYGMGPGGPGPQFRQYPGGPPFGPHVGGPMVAPMMAHGHSNGPFMGGVPQNLAPSYPHQMPMYSPSQQHAYLHSHGAAPPPPGSSGYPSPGRGAPMMMHQGSQQAHPPQPMMMYGMSPGQHHQPMYAPQQSGAGPSMRGTHQHGPPTPYGTSPHQAHHYPQPHRGGPSGHYGQPAHLSQPGGAHGLGHMNGPEGGSETK